MADLKELEKQERALWYERAAELYNNSKKRNNYWNMDSDTLSQVPDDTFERYGQNPFEEPAPRRGLFNRNKDEMHFYLNGKEISREQAHEFVRIHADEFIKAFEADPRYEEIMKFAEERNITIENKALREEKTQFFTDLGYLHMSHQAWEAANMGDAVFTLEKDGPEIGFTKDGMTYNGEPMDMMELAGKLEGGGFLLEQNSVEKFTDLQNKRVPDLEYRIGPIKLPAGRNETAFAYGQALVAADSLLEEKDALIHLNVMKGNTYDKKLCNGIQVKDGEITLSESGEKLSKEALAGKFAQYIASNPNLRNDPDAFIDVIAEQLETSKAGKETVENLEKSGQLEKVDLKKAEKKMPEKEKKTPEIEKDQSLGMAVLSHRMWQNNGKEEVVVEFEGKNIYFGKDGMLADGHPLDLQGLSEIIGKNGLAFEQKLKEQIQIEKQGDVVKQVANLRAHGEEKLSRLETARIYGEAYGITQMLGREDKMGVELEKIDGKGFDSNLLNGISHEQGHFFVGDKQVTDSAFTKKMAEYIACNDNLRNEHGSLGADLAIAIGRSYERFLKDEMRDSGIYLPTTGDMVHAFGVLTKSGRDVTYELDADTTVSAYQPEDRGFPEISIMMRDGDEEHQVILGTEEALRDFIEANREKFASVMGDDVQRALAEEPLAAPDEIQTAKAEPEQTHPAQNGQTLEQIEDAQAEAIAREEAQNADVRSAPAPAQDADPEKLAEKAEKITEVPNEESEMADFFNSMSEEMEAEYHGTSAAVIDTERGIDMLIDKMNQSKADIEIADVFVDDKTGEQLDVMLSRSDDGYELLLLDKDRGVYEPLMGDDKARVFETGGSKMVDSFSDQLAKAERGIAEKKQEAIG